MVQGTVMARKGLPTAPSLTRVDILAYENGLQDNKVHAWTGRKNSK